LSESQVGAAETLPNPPRGGERAGHDRRERKELTMTERPRTALVAGGGGALGSAVVATLLRRGERVCVPWIAEAEAQRLRATHPEAAERGDLRLSNCDAADADQVAALLDVLEADWGPLWLACSAVGGYAGGTNLEELDDLTLFERMLRLNLRTAAVVAREGLRHMGDAGGRVVLVGARQAVRPSAGEAPYNAAKAAVVSLVQTLGQELRGTGRTANAVLPGVIDTPANREAMPDATHERWVSPSAIAAVIAWLSSEEAWPVSGAAIPVYGDS
jgi:NAD(P)-dependent dehydrogenase (short-subunit alcohol dehydrogenase family)